MKDKILKLVIAGALALLAACASPTRLNFSCEDPTIDIYIDGEYAGKALVSYVFPNSKQVERNLQYSSGGRKAKTN